jgi:predicted GIY-YIG superfamily endonuclease
VYRLELFGKHYYGVTSDVERRYDEHALNPPAKMMGSLSDVEFKEVVRLEVMETFVDLRDAERSEREYITKNHTTDIRNGYNNLSSKPGWSRKWWWLYRRGLLRNQSRNAQNVFANYITSLEGSDDDTAPNDASGMDNVDTDILRVVDLEEEVMVVKDVEFIQL